MRPTIAASLCAILTLCACANHDGPSDNILTIEFSHPYTTNQSRALGEINNSNFQTSSFKVWGWKSDGSAVFSGTEVSFSDNEWQYSPKVKWDTSMSYDFVAIAPSDNIATASANSSQITISNIPQWQSAEQGIDYLVSEPISAITYNQASDGLQFTFHHILGKFRVMATYSPESTALVSKISRVSIDNFQLTLYGAKSLNYSSPISANPSNDFANTCWSVTDATPTTHELIASSILLSSDSYSTLTAPIFVAPTPAGISISANLELTYSVTLANSSEPPISFTKVLDDVKIQAFHQGYITNLCITINIGSADIDGKSSGSITANVNQNVVDFDSNGSHLYL